MNDCAFGIYTEREGEREREKGERERREQGEREREHVTRSHSVIHILSHSLTHSAVYYRDILTMTLT